MAVIVARVLNTLRHRGAGVPRLSLVLEGELAGRPLEGDAAGARAVMGVNGLAEGVSSVRPGTSEAVAAHAVREARAQPAAVARHALDMHVIPAAAAALPGSEVKLDCVLTVRNAVLLAHLPALNLHTTFVGLSRRPVQEVRGAVVRPAELTFPLLIVEPNPTALKW